MRDNPVLTAARATGDRVVPLFVLDRDLPTRSTNRFGFLCQSLVDLDSSLRERDAILVVRRGDWVQEILQLAYETRASTVHIARDVSAYSRRRLTRLRAAAEPVGVRIVEHDAVTVVPPDALEKPYLVFTPYWKRWLATSWRALEPIASALTLPNPPESVAIPDASPPGNWVGGETAGLARLKAWTARGLAQYEQVRDDPAVDATARLSPYLHFGCVSPLEVATRLRDRTGGDAFVRQLCWRDFFAQLLWARPELAHTDMRPARTARPVDDPGALAVWKEGRTGYPLVDAGMRQLRAEGWMHNRVRMVAASFLTKDLGIDWRAGAAHFMELLVDGDVASNQLNWQWVAGTGTDANPLRVLNPVRQAERFDAEGVYAHRWIPELDTPAYAAPIVDHGEAIERWKATRRDDPIAD